MSFIKPIAAVAALSIAALTVAAPAEARDRHRPRHHHGHGHNHHGHHGHGDAIAAGVFGLAAGALIAGALAQPRPQPRAAYAPDWVAYCSAKFKTYDPATNLYVGYDGYYHECR
jgi:hypothetical protein